MKKRTKKLSSIKILRDVAGEAGWRSFLVLFFKKEHAYFAFETVPLARVTGLEPATSGVTGRRSNQLSYTRIRECRV